MIQSKEEIIALCNKYNITKYSINLDGLIDVDGNVNLSNFKLLELPLKFNKVNGDFQCQYNQLTTLDGCPVYVGGIFFCIHNPLEHNKENLEILSRYNYDLDYYKQYYPNLYNMIISGKRINTIDNILQ